MNEKAEALVQIMTWTAATVVASAVAVISTGSLAVPAMLIAFLVSGGLFLELFNWMYDRLDS